MADVTIKYKERDLRRVRSLLSAYPKAVGKVMSRGVNNTTRSARTRIVRTLAGKTGLTQKIIRGAVYLRYRASYSRWSSAIGISHRGMSLLRLRARQTKKGVSYIDPEAGRRTLLPHAFIWERRGVFVRLGKERLPIEKQFGPALADIYRQAPSLAAQIQAETGRELHKNVMTQVRMVLQKARAS